MNYRSDDLDWPDRDRFILSKGHAALALYAVLLLSLRHVGISEQEVSWAQILAVFAFGRLISALPITPGGLGVIELGYIGGLVAAGGDEFVKDFLEHRLMELLPVQRGG